MIDWHSHILPGVDDGSRNVEESISILGMLNLQGVKTVIATPHFLANDESLESFLIRRKAAYDELKKHLPEKSPEILLGAEVKYYNGISKMSDLQKLKIENSKLLLLEMPMSKWTEYTVRELTELSCKGNMKIVLAHIERYMSFQKFSVWERLFESGLLMQVNATYFTSFTTKRKAISLLQDGMVHFLGSDCHNTTSRAPKLDKAYDVIKKKFGDEYINQMNEYGYSLFENQLNKFNISKG